MLGSWYCNIWFFMNKNDSNSCASLFYNLQDLSSILKGTWKKIMIVPNIDLSVTQTG